MEILHLRCAGIDVHKEVLYVCVLIGHGSKGQRHKLKVGTFHHELVELRRKLLEWGVTHVIMESTGVYWMPIYDVLDGYMTVIVANAQHVMNVPGRKTDETDAEWLAKLLRYGLVTPSFVPDRVFRELRQLTRYRRALVQARASEQNRVEKHLQISGIKLSTVTTAAFGVSGMDMLNNISQGKTDPAHLALLARGRLRKKAGQLAEAFAAPISEHTSNLIGLQLKELDRISRTIASVETAITERARHFRAQIKLLDGIPGINELVAIDVLAEIGTDMSRWATHRKIAAMGGVCPGNFISAGKRLKNKSRRGNPYLKSILVQAAASAINTNGSYFQAKYKRLKQSRGHKRAILAIAHAILVTIYHMLKNNEPYRDLGADRAKTVDPNREVSSLMLRIERLGFSVNLAPKS
jgi:transposase